MIWFLMKAQMLKMLKVTEIKTNNKIQFKMILNSRITIVKKIII